MYKENVRAGIIDFNPNQDPSDPRTDERNYSSRIGRWLPDNVTHEKVFFRDEGSIKKISDYDILFLSGSALMAAYYQDKVKGGETLDGDYAYVDMVANELQKNDAPKFGICFGAQLLAFLKGGEVGRMGEHGYPTIEAGYLAHRITEEGKHDPVFGFLGEDGDYFYGAQMHKDFVARLPGSGVVLATRRYPGRPEMIHAFRIGDCIGIQAHPEMSTQDDASFLVSANEEWLRPEIGDESYTKALAVPQVVNFEPGKALGRTITNFAGIVR